VKGRQENGGRRIGFLCPHSFVLLSLMSCGVHLIREFPCVVRAVGKVATNLSQLPNSSCSWPLRGRICACRVVWVSNAASQRPPTEDPAENVNRRKRFPTVSSGLAEAQREPERLKPSLQPGHQFSLRLRHRNFFGSRGLFAEDTLEKCRHFGMDRDPRSAELIGESGDRILDSRHNPEGRE